MFGQVAERYSKQTLREAREILMKLMDEEEKKRRARRSGEGAKGSGGAEESTSLNYAAKRGSARDDEASGERRVTSGELVDRAPGVNEIHEHKGCGAAQESRSLDYAERFASGSARDDEHRDRCEKEVKSMESAEMKSMESAEVKSMKQQNSQMKSIIIDVPFRYTARTIKQGSAAGDKTILRCQRRLADGRQCGLPAYDRVDQCERHYRWYSLAPNFYELPYPENATAVQETLARTATLLLRKQIEPRVADSVVRLCKEMMRNLPAYERELELMEKSLRWEEEGTVQ